MINYKNHARISIVLIVCFVLMTIMSGCVTKDTNPKSENTSADANTNENVLLGAGETAEIEKLQITLVGALVPKNSSPGGEEKYVILQYKVKNTGASEIKWDGKSIYHFDSTLGEKKEGITGTGIETNLPAEGSIAPGATAEFEAVYKVYIGLSQAEFRYNTSQDTPDLAKWKIDIK